jgi:N-acetylmuramoyl-L-alanine amidase
MITEETVQEKAAFQIAMGIMQFLHSPSFNPQ